MHAVCMHSSIRARECRGRTDATRASGREQGELTNLETTRLAAVIPPNLPDFHALRFSNARSRLSSVILAAKLRAFSCARASV